MIAVALDESADDVIEWANGITYPVLVDRDHRLAEAYGITNVPTTVWIDENDQIVRPNAVGFSTDTFKDFTGFESNDYLDAIKRWAETGEVDVDAEAAVAATVDLDAAEVEGQLWFRAAAHLRRQGNEDAAAKHFAKAAELAPNDFTVRRAAMPLTGVDPFGEAFFELHREWLSNGAHYNGLGISRA